MRKSKFILNLGNICKYLRCTLDYLLLYLELPHVILCKGRNSIPAS